MLLNEVIKFNFFHIFSAISIYSFFNKINDKINKYIIYTFSDISSLYDIISKKIEFKDLIIKEEFVDEIESEKYIDKILAIPFNKNNKSLLIFHFREVDMPKMEYITYKINQYELNEIKIIFIIHIQRKKILNKNNNEENNLIYSYNNLLLNINENKNDSYEHIFIDNLFSNEDYLLILFL